MTADFPEECVPADNVTVLLQQWRHGDEDAVRHLMPLVYDELRGLAAKYLRSERGDHTLQPTALVHEAYVRLVGADVTWQDRAHFYALSARLMRRILVDHARARTSQKRGGGLRAVTLDEAMAATNQNLEQLLDLDTALEKLAELDQRKAQVVELHYFGDLSYDEAAEVLGISAATVDRDLRFAKTWLMKELAESVDAPHSDATGA